MVRAKIASPANPDAEENEGHPLFPHDEGEEAPKIGWIQIRRAEAGAGWVTAPQKYRAHELESEEDLHRMYGGGTYELYGRATTAKGFMGPITARRTITLAGKSKPLIATPEPEEADEDEARHDGNQMPYFPGMGGMGVDVGAIIGSLQQSAQAQQAQQLALFTGFMQQQSAMFQAQLAGAKSEGQTVAQLMIEQSRAQTEMFRMQAQKAEAIAERAIAQKGDGGNGLESTLRLMDLLERRVENRVRDLEKSKGKSAEEDDMTGPLLTLAGGIMQAMSANAANHAPPAPPPARAPLPPPMAPARQVEATPTALHGAATVAAPPAPASSTNGAGALELNDAAIENDATVN